MDKTIDIAQEIAAQYIKAERFQTWTHDYLMQRLMELVTVSAAAEREACLSVIKPNATPMEIAAAIRARGNT
jgi:hypothetical protein